jgi:hypothetical protein
LPTYGDYGQKTQIVAKNQENGTLYYRACSFLRDDPETILQNISKFKQSDTYYANRFLPHQFVNCGTTQKLPVQIKQNAYRQEQIQDVDFTKLFSGEIPEIVEVGVESFDKSRGYLYMRTNL